MSGGGGGNQKVENKPWEGVRDYLVNLYKDAAALQQNHDMTPLQGLPIDQRLQSTADEARVRAAEFERDRLNALVHDKVLTTLILAANASEPAQLKAAAASAASLCWPGMT